MAFAGYTGYYGPYLENHYFRYALAGTTATVAVELSIHGLDTLNMRSKAVEGGNKKLLQSLLKWEGFVSLFRGVSSVPYGYAPSAALYFYLYPQFRDNFYERWRNYNQSKIEAAYEQMSKNRTSGHQ